MTESKPQQRVLIIGAGPAGFYTIEELAKRFSASGIPVHFDIINRDVRPGGLLMYGVAPDHQKIRSLWRVFEKTLNRPEVSYFGNVSFGHDVTYEEIRGSYDVIVFSVGAQSDRPLGIPGEDLRGSASAREFVAWYNALPEYVGFEPRLDTKTVCIVGAGNVAADVARVLAKTPDELSGTDIGHHALTALERSEVEDIYILIRRSAAHVKFTPAELKDLGQLQNADVIVEPSDLQLSPDLEAALTESKEAQKNFALLQEFSARGLENKPRRIHFKFLVSPKSARGEDGKMSEIVVVKNEIKDGRLREVQGSEFLIPAGMLLRSVGYHVLPLPGLPYDQSKGIIANTAGRVQGEDYRGVYVVGWAADGPLGIIGTNKTRARIVADKIMEDVESGNLRESNAKGDDSFLSHLLQAKGVHYVNAENWQKIAACETQAGIACGRPIRRFESATEMLRAIGLIQ